MWGMTSALPRWASSSMSDRTFVPLLKMSRCGLKVIRNVFGSGCSALIDSLRLRGILSAKAFFDVSSEPRVFAESCLN